MYTSEHNLHITRPMTLTNWGLSHVSHTRLRANTEGYFQYTVAYTNVVCWGKTAISTEEMAKSLLLYRRMK